MPQTAQTHRAASGAARYTELKIYAALFFVLVASVFVVNFNLANESNRDAERIFCATKQQEYWQRAQRNLYQVKTNLLVGANADSLFEEFSMSVLAFDSTVTALLRGNTIVLGKGRVDIAAVQDVRTRRIIDYINEIWAPHRATFNRLIESRRTASGKTAGRIDETLLDEAVDYTARFDESILSSSRAFVVKLGEISTERTNKLQFIQISALTLSLMVFAAMGLRLAVSLRKQDAVIRESQQQLIQSEKMASLGQMVAGLVHEMNTPLGFVRSNIEITERNHSILSDAISEYESMSTTLEQGDLSHLESQLQSVKERSEKIHKFNLIEKTRTLLSQSLVGLDRIQELILNLKNFSRLDEASLKPADINEGLDSALVIAQNMIKARATIEKRYAAHLVAECHAAQLNQVFLNLIMNAAQAITPKPSESGGTEAERQGRIVITTIAEPQWATIKISDNGSGIRPEHLRRIFEPFFTTKRVGEGTGLGLSIAYKIIEQHGGTIDVKSDVGMGTTFTVRIPLRHIQKPVPNDRLSKMIQNNSQTSITTPLV